MPSIKILHTGDIHLDSPFSGLDAHRSEVRRNELRGTFTSLMTYARTENVDLFLITGDMFDVGFATRETISLLIREISKLKCPVVISPGNHDPAGEGSVWRKNVFPDNTYIFTSEELSSFEFPELGFRVYGWGFEKTAMRDNPLAGKKAENDGLVNVLSVHCDLTSPISASCPLTADELLAFGADYCALGHVHNPDSVSLPHGISYCGCLEGRSFDETGPKGAVLCEIGRRSSPGEEVPVRYSRVRFSKRRYESLSLAVDGVADGEELKEKISNFISERKYGDDTLLRLTLTGRVREDLAVDTAALSDLGERLYALDVRDETTPDWNASALAADPTVKGEFYRVLEPLLTSPEPEKRKIASAALRYGLAALAGERFVLRDADRFRRLPIPRAQRHKRAQRVGKDVDRDVHQIHALRYARDARPGSDRTEEIRQLEDGRGIGNTRCRDRLGRRIQDRKNARRRLSRRKGNVQGDGYARQGTGRRTRKLHGIRR